MAIPLCVPLSCPRLLLYLKNKEFGEKYVIQDDMVQPFEPSVDMKWEADKINKSVQQAWSQAASQMVAKPYKGLILDETDGMLDMGFKHDICKVLFEIRLDRQTVMTSATWPADVQQLANQYMKKNLHVHVGSLDLAVVSP